MAAPVRATLATAQGSDADLRLTSKWNAVKGNNTSIALVDPDDDNRLEVIVQEEAGDDGQENRIIVLLESDDDTLETTALEVINAINAHPVASKLVQASRIPTSAALDNDASQGANAALVFTARPAGAEGNQITVAYVLPVDDNQAHPIAVSVTGTYAIVVTLGVDSDGSTIVSTAANVKTAIEAHAQANGLVTVANKAGNNGTGLVSAFAAAALTGGLDGGAGVKTALAVTKLASGVDASFADQAEVEAAPGFDVIAYNSPTGTYKVQYHANDGSLRRFEIYSATDEATALAALNTFYNRDIAGSGLA